LRNSAFKRATIVRFVASSSSSSVTSPVAKS
jgi:hypothetical protein